MQNEVINSSTDTIIDSYSKEDKVTDVVAKKSTICRVSQLLDDKSQDIATTSYSTSGVLVDTINEQLDAIRLDIDEIENELNKLNKYFDENEIQEIEDELNKLNKYLDENEIQETETKYKEFSEDLSNDDNNKYYYDLILPILTTLEEENLDVCHTSDDIKLCDNSLYNNADNDRC